MPDNVSIAYRGANYAIGQGPQFYGIWHAAAPQNPPLEWWPLTPEGWTGAWSRFASVEVPGTITPAGATSAPAAVAPASAGATPAAAETSPATGTPPPSDAAESPAAVASGPSGPQAAEDAIDPQYGQVVERPASPARVLRNPRIAAALLAVGVLLGVIGLFPTYSAGVSLAAQSVELVPHLIYLAAWAGSAVLILLGGVRRQAGALLGAGVSAVTLGLFFADLGIPIADGANLLGAGLVLSIIGWFACAAGAVLAFAASGLTFRGRPAGSRRPRLASHEIVPTVVIILAAIGAAVAFAPAWDRYLLQTGFGTSQTETAGNAFVNPAPVIVGDVAVMVLLVAAVVAAALWRPIRLGAALAVGAIIPMVAQAISAIIQVSQPTPPAQFGISQAQASQLGLKITNGLTPMFWVFCAFLGTLILLCIWMLLTVDSPPDRGPFYPGLPYHGQPYPGQPYQAQLYPGQPYQAQPYPGQPYWSGTVVPSDATQPSPGGPGVPSHPAPQ
ncbi:MAG TPA: hypothetical protein VGH53_04325 [Streptosporangiaceae bacterium]